MTIRTYKDRDYAGLIALYMQPDLYGGQYDENRDSRDKIAHRIAADPESVYVAEDDEGQIVGTVSTIEDGRVAWLFRFAVAQVVAEQSIAEQLFHAATQSLRARGHSQVLIYSPAGDDRLDSRYEQLGFMKGSDYTCYYKNIL